ncbi:Protein adenylyltransferase SelO, mitochondrial [Lamellibrachia satsuma]|nr:Protein adenylyltransferase SelO, mitochondrial [Lamellibrachia satsuma]
MLQRFLQITTIKQGSVLGSSRSTSVLLHQRTNSIPLLQNHSRNMATLETLKFNNTALHNLPVDENASNAVRETPGVVFTRVSPTPVENPHLVSYSAPALELLDLLEEETRRPEFVQYFSGNRVLPGAEPAAHCYCGHQFGTFAGQLGDGAAVYLGQVENKKGECWEIQLKGSGKTPYSRTADGRKVLRSSIREYLCSEAMFHLGIPTTRAATCVTSDTMVPRDIHYTGDIIEERATVILRIAPTFLRFGSFEIFKPTDPVSRRHGPSEGRQDILVQLLDYTIQTCYPQIWQSHLADKASMYLAFYREVVKRTAQLVARWQCVGWCHGVLNTDNVSIVGVTIDYGPYGFIDQFESGFVCNSSDDRGRYAFDCQPEMCKWNCHKLAEALEPVLPMSQMEEALQSYDVQYEEFYHQKMMKKFGLMKSFPEDKYVIYLV